MAEKSTGVVYVATRKERYVQEAFLSALSAKDMMSGVPVTLFTDLENSVFVREDCFDKVVPIDTVSQYDRRWSEGQLDRVQCLPDSPYDYTLHLDTDTRVRSPELGTVFSLLDEHDIAMVECSPDNSYSREHYDRPMFNVGFILYRKNDRTDQMLREWARLTREHFDIASKEAPPEPEFLAHVDDPEIRRKLLFMDQTSMVRIFSPEVNLFDLEHRILDESWNYRGKQGGGQPAQPVKLDHHPALRKMFFRRDLVAAGMRYQNQGGITRALEIFEALLTETPADMNLMKMIFVCHLQQQHNDRAMQMLDAMLAQHPDYPWATSAKEALRTRMEESNAG